MNSLMPLYQYLLADASRWCRVSTQRDFETISLRVKHEGLSFLTITLPSFCSDFERSLADEGVSPSFFVGFSKNGTLPRFLGGLFGNVFDQNSGRLLLNPCVDSIYFIRQICLYTKKIKLPCSPQREKTAFTKYLECEQDVRKASRALTSEQLSSFHYVSGLLFGNLLHECDSDISSGNIVPKHGPGKTADKIIGNKKFLVKTWTRRLEENFFPSGDFIIPNYGFSENLLDVTFLEPGSETPVNVVSVPKTLKTPRIIAMEPAHMQYAQQALMELLVNKLEGSKFLGKMIGFLDQSLNQELARKGSKDGSYATLDLSEASDRVSLRLVARLLAPYSSLLRAVMACRSKTASVPGFGTLSLAKFASMGSALCFPIEAMVFLTIIFCGIQKELGRPLVTKDILQYLGHVRVFGDDIVIPTTYALSVVESLEAYGLKVNTAKSFWTGKFRESCGGEYYDGVPVKPVRLTMMPPSHRRQAREFVAFADQRNQLYELGNWLTVRHIDNWIGRLAPFPIVGRDSQAIGRTSFLTSYEVERLCPRLFRPLVKAVVIVSKIPKSSLDGYGALMKFFLKRGEQPIFNKDHLSFAGRPRSVDTRLRWVLPF